MAERTVVRMKKVALLLAVLVPFVVFSLFVVESQGFLPLLALVKEPWGLQVLLDLVLALGLFSVWMVGDAKQRGITAWPYIFAILGLGSIGALAYLVHRSAKEVSQVRAGERAVAAR